ncbi:hypothetical protein [Streptomyces viridochromogenes]|uniref:hypothetical protein n=1 Tax=Streptomyces viridochromogenes TaxID=1938 RepID=UPI000A93B6CC|nr:hypothetical protein [Streptomyces viridochromogenes]
MSRLGGAVPRAVRVTAVAGGAVTEAVVEATAVVVPGPRIASACPTNPMQGPVLLRGYPVPCVTWRDPSPFT